MERLTYRVIDGIKWVAGAPVPDNRLVSLTKAEALFDLSLGRLVLDRPVRRGGKSRQAEAPADDAPEDSGSAGED